MMNYIIYGIHFQLQMNKKFKEKLIYFSKEYQEIIIEAEKIKMNKIFNIITKITNESQRKRYNNFKKLSTNEFKLL